jgi:hypothetical protein
MEAIGYRTDVKTRAEEFVSEQKDKVTGAVSGAKDTVVSKASRVVPSRETIRHGAHRVSDTAQSNPVGMAVGAAAAGFLVGMLVPSTRVEDDRIGEMADQVKDKVSDAGQEALERGRAVAGEAKDAAVETLRDRGLEETKELSASVRSEESPNVSDLHRSTGDSPSATR